MSTRTVAKKLLEGTSAQGWSIVGYGGSVAGALRPLEEYIKKRVQCAVKAEREACAQVAESTVCDTHLPTGVQIYGGRVAKAIRARGSA